MVHDGKFVLNSSALHNVCRMVVGEVRRSVQCERCFERELPALPSMFLHLSCVGRQETWPSSS